MILSPGTLPRDPLPPKGGIKKANMGSFAVETGNESKSMVTESVKSRNFKPPLGGLGVNSK